MVLLFNTVLYLSSPRMNILSWKSAEMANDMTLMNAGGKKKPEKWD